MTFDELYEDFESWLRGYAINLTHDSDLSDDLVQETFIRAMTNMFILENLKYYQCRTWLRQTLKNLFIDEHRSRQRHLGLIDQVGRDSEGESYTMPDFTAYDLLESAPQQDRELLHQRYVLGMNSSEIGVELGIPAATVRSRLHLALKRLRQLENNLL